MSARPTTLFELFGNFTAAWPKDLLRKTPGIEVFGDADVETWLAALNVGLKISNVRMAALDGQAAIEADVAMDNAVSGFTDGFPIVIGTMPDVEFRLKGAPNKTFKLLVGINAAGMPEVLIEGAPVEIHLPVGLVGPHPGPVEGPPGIGSVSVGSFTPGNADDLQIEYNISSPTIISVHMRVHMTADRQISLRPAVPISFGPCLFSDLPCRAVHDFSLIPSPGLIGRTIDWIRDDIVDATQVRTPDIGTSGGAFAVRSFDLDMAAAPLKSLGEWLKNSADSNLPAPQQQGGEPDEFTRAEIVLNDFVVPFFGLPRHLTAGLRRLVVNPKDPKEVFAFDRAPVLIYLSRDPPLAIKIESFFVRIPDLKEPDDEDAPTVKGVTLAASIIRSNEEPASGPKPLTPQAIEIALGENLTLRFIYRRAFDPVTQLPLTGEGASFAVNNLLHHEIVGVSIDVMAVRIGLSMGKFFLTEPEQQPSFQDCAEATIDLFISSPPTGDDDSFFKLRGLDGEKIAFAIEGLGWYQGEKRLTGSGLPQLPDGVAIFFGPVQIIVQEIGLLAEQGGTYLAITAGVAIGKPKGTSGSVVLNRARFKISGKAEAPPFLLDGIFASLKAPGLELAAGGYYSDRTEGDARIREFGLSGTIAFVYGGGAHGLSLDLLIGSLSRPAANEKFRYFLAQAVYRSVLLGGFEVRNMRLLFANNLLPKLAPADAAAGTLRFFNWFRQTNPLRVPGDRRLAAWKPEDGAFAAGMGAGASLPALGKLCEFNAFIMMMNGDSESGILIAGELTLLDNPKPIGFFALEADVKNDRLSMVVGVDLKIPDFMTDAPEWSKNVGELSGTLFISNKPGTFAIGRLADQRTWLTLKFDIDFIFKAVFRFAFCLEITSGGPAGVGLIVSAEGGIKRGSIFQLTFLLRFALSAASFSTGSSDGALTITIELSGRVVLFRFLRLGLSLLADLRYLVTKPSRTELVLRFRFETPWYLPDFSWTLDLTFGGCDPGAMATAVCPLRTAAAIEGPGRANAPLHLARFAPDDPGFDPDWDGSGTVPTFSVRQFSGPVTPEPSRLARFAADTKVRPIAIDSTIAIDWSVAVNDQLSLGAGIATGLGSQAAGELELTYDLVAIKVRRRARFGNDRPWRELDLIEELPPDFSDPDGIGLAGEYGPQSLTKVWDHDLRIDGQTAAKRLLINGATPFSFTTGDNETDEETIAGNPNWPCCPPRPKGGVRYKTHLVEFRQEPPGRRIMGERVFSESQSRLGLLRPAIVRPSQLGQLVPPNAIIAFLKSAVAGPFLRVEFDKAAAFCTLRMAWGRALGMLELVGFDALGEVVAQLQISLGGATSYQDVVLTPKGRMLRMEARLLLPPDTGSPPGVTINLPPGLGLAIEFDRISYVALDDYLNDQRFELACLGVEASGANGYSGQGKLFFLPNHDYEIAVTTRLTVAHPSKPPESADVTEHVYFATKGLPGLNAAARTGEEVEPYVASAYGGGSGLLYREEPASLAFTESFLVAVPLSNRPAGTSDEQTILHRLQLLVEPDVATGPETLITATAADWIVDHRTTAHPPTRFDWVNRVSKSLLDPVPMQSADPFRLRLARMTQLNRTGCALPDPLDVTGAVLVAPPQGDPHPDLPGQEVWPPRRGMVAIARAEGAAFIDRRPFVAADHSAFTFATDAGPAGGAHWSLDEGRLKLAGSPSRAFAIFGDADWNHVRIQAEIRCDGGAGIGVGLRQSSAGEGLFATLERGGTGLSLAIFLRSTGNADIELIRKAVANPPGPDTAIVLSVEAFDDRLRATALDTVVEIDRHVVREGRLALFGDGTASFAALQVRGLDIYRFPFATSRFVSFAEHIGSFGGAIAVARPDDLGAGSTTETVSGLWTATRAEIATAMLPDAEATARQDLFDRWLTGLGLPLRQEVPSLALTKFVAAAQAEAILLESPEPLDFARDVKLQLAPVGAPPPMPVIPLPGDAGRRGLPGGRGRLPLPDPGTERQRIILSVTAIENGYRIELDTAALAAQGEVPDEIVAVERTGRGFAFYKGRLARLPRRLTRVFVNVRRDSVLPDTDPAPPMPVLLALKQIPPGALALLNFDMTAIADIFMLPRPLPPIELTVLQDATGLRALLIPHRGANHASLNSGIYELGFSIDRMRWPTTAIADIGSRYRDETVLTLQL